MGIIERVTPLILSIIITIIFYKANFNFAALKDYKFVYSNIISFASIIIGALITMVSILSTFTGRKVMKKIKKNKADGLLKNYFIYPICSGVILALYSVSLGILYDESKVLSNVQIITSIVWIFLLSYFVATTGRVFFVMLKLLSAVYEEDAAPERKRSEVDSSKVSFEKPQEH